MPFEQQEVHGKVEFIGNQAIYEQVFEHTLVVDITDNWQMPPLKELEQAPSTLILKKALNNSVWVGVSKNQEKVKQCWLTMTPNRDDNRQIIFEPDSDEWCEPIWIDKDLLIINETKVWLFKNAACSENHEAKLIASFDLSEISHTKKSKYIGCYQDIHYVLFNGQICKWINQEFIPIGVQVEQVYEPWFYIDEHGYLYFTNKGLLYQYNLTDMSYHCRQILVEVPGNVNGTTVNIADRCLIQLQKYNNDWLVFAINGGRFRINELAQFWNPKTDTWIRLKTGALGKYDITNIALQPDGATLVYGHNHHQGAVLRIENLLERIYKDKTNHFQPALWDEDEIGLKN